MKNYENYFKKNGFIYGVHKEEHFAEWYIRVYRFDNYDEFERWYNTHKNVEPYISHDGERTYGDIYEANSKTAILKNYGRQYLKYADNGTFKNWFVTN